MATKEPLVFPRSNIDVFRGGGATLCIGTCDVAIAQRFCSKVLLSAIIHETISSKSFPNQSVGLQGKNFSCSLPTCE